jgi:hypothetical protein
MSNQNEPTNIKERKMMNKETPVFQDKDSLMNALEFKSMTNAILNLKARGCMYTVTDVDGNVYTNTVTQKKSKKRSQSFDPYVRPFLDKLQVGDIIEIPYHIYTGADLQSNICARAHARWGSKSVMTTTDNDKKVVMVLREH